MKLRCVCAIIVLLCVCLSARSQTCPPNLDFEAGNFDNWECFVGAVDVKDGKNQMKLIPSNPVPTRHQVISADENPGLDRYGEFPQLCPYGGGYSVKLGNEATGAEAEAISYTFQVPTTIDTFTFTYFYAVVFEDPQHDLSEQPRFFVTAYDVATGDLINCASYDYVSSSALPGFQKSKLNPGVLYKSWTPTSLQFAGMGGREVRIEFRTADCTRNAHFGYAYMDIASACSNILATAPYCVETNSLILDAPFGFQSYTWYNADFSKVIGSGQSMTLSPPPATSGTFYVDVVPYPGFGCRDTLTAFVKPLPVPELPETDTVLNYCQFQSSIPLAAKGSSGNQLRWYTSPTGGIGTTNAPSPPTNVAGVFKFYVSQKALFGCEGFRREIVVNVIPTPVVSFTVNTSRQCENGNSFVFSSTSTNLEKPNYVWEFGNGQTFSSADQFATYTYPAPGNFIVKLKVLNGNLCKAEKTHMVTVVAKPVAMFEYPAVICENQTQVKLSDRSHSPGNLSTINRWWWDINGKQVQGQAPASFTASAGLLPVKLVATTVEGCPSDTNTVNLNIRYAPRVAFEPEGLMCNNETIRFADRSFMPAGGESETISKWQWTFNNVSVATTQHHAAQFSSGHHTVRLVAETQVGCIGVPLERSFTVHPKPEVSLSINDSCILVPITYRANDHAGNVVRWDWNFGTGFRAGPPAITTTYHAEGSRPFVLMAHTDQGCKDTVNRAFIVYDNKSFAGYDTVAAFAEPVGLDARGEPGMQYAWTPSTGLDHSDIEKPFAILDRDETYLLSTVTEKGCKKQSRITIKRYAGPALYVPSGFTPNNDGLNDRFKVTPVGIRSFGYLAVYNRWGQLIFRTTDYNQSWDGTLKGTKLGPDTFVYYVQAIDYRGKPMLKKGTVTLIR